MWTWKVGWEEVWGPQVHFVCGEHHVSDRISFNPNIFRWYFKVVMQPYMWDNCFHAFGRSLSTWMVSGYSAHLWCECSQLHSTCTRLSRTWLCWSCWTTRILGKSPGSGLICTERGWGWEILSEGLAVGNSKDGRIAPRHLLGSLHLGPQEGVGGGEDLPHHRLCLRS